MKELQLVVDDSNYDLAVDTSVFLRDTLADYYLWSSSENLALEVKPSSWIIRLKDGLFYDYENGRRRGPHHPSGCFQFEVR